MATDTTNLKKRLFAAGTLMLVIYAFGTVGYFILGDGRWSPGDCAYMTVISLTTVGYGEVLPGIENVPYARAFTAGLLVLGAGIALYFVSVLTTFLVEGEFLQLQRKRRMIKQIKNMSDHIIVCGVGGTGSHVVEELIKSKWPFVAIDTDEDRLNRRQEAHGEKFICMHGDATDDAVLVEACIKRAYGVVASLPDDMGNLYIVVTARGLNPELRIVAKAMDPAAEPKLRVAGADSVVSINTINGLRMSSEMIRPHVVSFLDKMLHDKDKNLRFEEVTIPDGSQLVDSVLANSGLRKERNLLIVAARERDSDRYTYSPGGGFKLGAGMTLILLGETESVERLRRSSLFRRQEG